MKSFNFTLSTEQYEVLLAFEDFSSLAEVAKKVRRDSSVVSRTLKAISEQASLVEKVDGKWRITPLGRQFNRLTKHFVETQQKLIQQSDSLRFAPAVLPTLNENSALLLLGTQKGFLNPIWGPRNNPDVESKILQVLTEWRKRKYPVIFCQHLSQKKGSPLSRGSDGSHFIAELKPRGGEKVFEKTFNSAFVESDLEKYLRKQSIQNLILVGFSTNYCVDATARAAFDLGFNVYVVSDAVATFDRVGPDGKNYSADVLHSAALASLHQEYATILDCDSFIRHLSEI